MQYMCIYTLHYTVLLVTTKWSWKPLFPARYFPSWALLLVLVAALTDTGTQKETETNADSAARELG